MFEKIFSSPSLSTSSRIVFDRQGDGIVGLPRGIFTIRPDGSDCIQLRSYGSDPKWSPDGKWIAFRDLPDGYPPYATNVYVMQTDGSQVTLLTRQNENAVQTLATWSPDSKKIAYSIWTGKVNQIWVVDVNSRMAQQLTHRGNYEFLAWTPESEIVFLDRDEIEILVMNQDGQNQRQCSLFDRDDREITWSRDGSKIVFLRDGAICVMNSDGTNLRTLKPEGRIPTASLSPDKQYVVYSAHVRKGTGFGIHVINVDGSGQKTLVTNPNDGEGLRGKQVNSQGVCWSPWL